METSSLPGFDPRIAQPLAGSHTATLFRPSFVLQYKLLTTCLSRKGNSRKDTQSIPRHKRSTAGSLAKSQPPATNPRFETKGKAKERGQFLNKRLSFHSYFFQTLLNPLNPELNPICYLLALLEAHHFLHVSRIRVKLLTFRLLTSYIYIWSTHS